MSPTPAERQLVLSTELAPTISRAVDVSKVRLAILETQEARESTAVGHISLYLKAVEAGQPPPRWKVATGDSADDPSTDTFAEVWQDDPSFTELIDALRYSLEGDAVLLEQIVRRARGLGESFPLARIHDQQLAELELLREFLQLTERWDVRSGAGRELRMTTDKAEVAARNRRQAIKLL